MSKRRVSKELKDMKTFKQRYADKQYVAYIEAEDSNWFTNTSSEKMAVPCRGFIKGPSGTPYQDGTYHLKIIFPINYPFNPPKITIITRIYHPKINDRGGIHLSILEKNGWSPALTIGNVCCAIIKLLKKPLPSRCKILNKKAADHYKNDRNEYWRIAALYNQQYATLDIVEFDDDSLCLLEPVTIHILNEIYDIINRILTNDVFNGNDNLTNIVIEYFGEKEDEMIYCSDYEQYILDLKRKEMQRFAKHQGQQNMIIFIKTYTGKTVTLKVNKNDFGYYLKYKCMELEGIDIEQQGLIFAGKQIEDKKRLKNYNMRSECTVMMIFKFRCFGG